MVERVEFSLRPLPTENPENAFRVHLTSNDLTVLGLKSGQLCRLKNTDGVMGTGIAWRSTDGGTNRGVIKVSHFLKDTYGLRFQQPIFIESGGEWQQVEKVMIREIPDSAGGSVPDNRSELELLARYALYRLPAIYNGLTFDVSPKGGRKRKFLIVSIQPSHQRKKDLALYSFAGETCIEFASKSAHEAEADAPAGALRVPEDAVAGLSTQIRELNRVLLMFGMRFGSSTLSRSIQLGILLYGPRGTGKSSLLNKITEASWRKVVRINGPVGKSALSDAFTQALQNQPSVIILDNLHDLAGSHERLNATDRSTVSALAQEIDGIKNQRVLVVGATRRLDEVDSDLRVSYRLSIEIEVPVPDVQARKEILKALNWGATNPALLEQIGEETHGYVGADLQALVLRAGIAAMNRNLSDEQYDFHQCVSTVSEKTAERGVWDADLHFIKEDFEIAKRAVKPSAMREVFLETPNVKWSDVGGSDEVKEQLKRMTEWPFTRAKAMAYFDVEPQKGLLLYGPPGCSKTLTAKALASEGKLNFLAVKGAELISKYVGDSERAIRDVFQKARTASPSILFFDEIDSIAAKRESSSHTGGLNVLTTLLNEMDGIEDFKGVIVLAATNKPELLDEALMRPGRFDVKLYIGPPNHAARRQIFEINTRKKPLNKNVNLERLSNMTEGHSGAEIAQICKMAAEIGLADCDHPDGIGFIYQTHFEEALRQIPRQITPQMKEKYENWASNGI
ncbi:MAG: hypothetical protein M1822_009838 [Bathelium mastoideum]|nr:MAG: hypothetical protein M1822_009838 [Bathelium mastoideum]